jgi:lambda family phage portal protein
MRFDLGINWLRAAVGKKIINAGYQMSGNPHYLPAARELMDAVGRKMRMYYDGAAQKRTRAGWGHTTDTPYNNIASDLKRLIARSRQSSDNNGLSDKIDQTYISNVVYDGIKPDPKVRDENGELLDEVNNKLAEGWKRYNDQYDRRGKHSYYQSQELQLKTIINSGSVLRNIVKAGRGSYLPIANQLIEPDRLDWSKDTVGAVLDDMKKRRSTQFGIDLDKYGVPVRFHVDGLKTPVSARQMDIRYKQRRTEQYIGVPWKAPILKYLWDVGSLIEDKLTQSRIQSMIALWMHKNDLPAAHKGVNDDNEYVWSPGEIMYGTEKPQVISSPTGDMQQNFDPLIRLIQRIVGIGVGLSYQVLTKDLQGMNFASSRANIIEDRRQFRMVQAWFISEVCQRDWNTFVYWMFASGKMAPLTFSDYERDMWMWSQCKWQPPGWDWVDPSKDARAAIDLMSNGMMTLAQHYGEKGKNWQDEVEQAFKEKARIKELQEKYGVELLGAGGGGTENVEKADNEELQRRIEELTSDS